MNTALQRMMVRNSTVLSVCICASLFVWNCKSNAHTERPAEKSAEFSGDVSAALADAPAPETVTFTTSDGIVITGSLFVAQGSATPAVLCLHQWRSDRSSYDKLAEKLRASGYTVLSIDMRGFGGSAQRSDGSKVSPDRVAMKDVEAAIGFLRKSRGVDPAQIGIIGASYGSSNALIYAAGDPQIKAVALLSPGLNYFNVLPIEASVSRYGKRPILAVASSEDERSVEAVARIKELAAGKIIDKLYDNAGHGTEILSGKTDLETLILDFFSKFLLKK